MTDMRIISLRREFGWTQERLAAESGVGVRTIQRLEAGDDGSLETLHRIAAALGVPVKDLFEATAEEGETSPPVRSGTVRRSVGIAVSLAVAGVVIGAATAFAQPITFVSTARATVAVSDPQSGIPAAPGSKLAREVAQSDALVATTPFVLDRVRALLGSTSDAQGLTKSVAARIDPETALLVVTARAGTSALAEQRADAVLQTLIASIPELSPASTHGGQRVTRVGRTSTQLDPARIDGLVRGGGTGLGGGLLAGLLVVLFRRRRRGAPQAVGRVVLSGSIGAAGN